MYIPTEPFTRLEEHDQHDIPNMFPALNWLSEIKLAFSSAYGEYEDETALRSCEQDPSALHLDDEWEPDWEAMNAIYRGPVILDCRGGEILEFS